MREALLGLIVISICLVSLVRPKIGLYGYLWYGLMLPDVYAWSRGNSYSMVLAICLLLGSVRKFPNFFKLFKNPFVVLFLLLQIPIALSVYVGVSTWVGLFYYRQFVQLSVVALLIPLVIETVGDMRWLLLVMGGSLGVLGSKYGLWALLHGGAYYTGGPGSFMSENNTFALALCMAFPLLWFGRNFWSLLPLKALWGVMAALSLVTIIMTHSRGGALTLAAILLILAFRSTHKFAVLLLLVMLTGGAVYMVRNTFISRLETIENPLQDASARERLESQLIAVKMFLDHPLAGVGFGGENFMLLRRQYETGPHNEMLVVHNNYLEMAVDSGIFAFLLFCALLFGSIWWLGRSGKRLRKLGNGLRHYPYAIQTSLLAFAVGSTFASRTYYDFIYMMLMTAAAWYNIAHEASVAAATSVRQIPASVPALSRTTPALPTKPAPVPRGALSIQRQLSLERRKRS